MLLPAVASASRGTKTQSKTKTFMLAARRPLVASVAIYTELRRSEGASKRVVLQTGLHGGGWCCSCQKRAHPSSWLSLLAEPSWQWRLIKGVQPSRAQERFGTSAGVDSGKWEGMLYKRYDMITLSVTRHSTFLRSHLMNLIKKAINEECTLWFQIACWSL